MSEKLLNLKIILLPEGIYLATCDILPGLIAQGRTLNETLEIARDVARKILDSYREHGEKISSGLRDFDNDSCEIAIPVRLD